jgi:hypothetical protein
VAGQDLASPIRNLVTMQKNRDGEQFKVSFYQQAGISKFMGLALQSISNHSE